MRFCKALIILIIKWWSIVLRLSTSYKTEAFIAFVTYTKDNKASYNDHKIFDMRQKKG